MRRNVSHYLLPVIAVLVIALAVAVTGCKKKMPKEEAPPPAPPKVEEVAPPAPDTTGQAAASVRRLWTPTAPAS